MLLGFMLIIFILCYRKIQRDTLFSINVKKLDYILKQNLIQF